MDMRRLVGRNVRRIRLEKGLTQEAFAETSGFIDIGVPADYALAQELFA